jgi:hypothetical protein
MTCQVVQRMGSTSITLLEYNDEALLRRILVTVEKAA